MGDKCARTLYDLRSGHLVYSGEAPRDLCERLREHVESNPTQSEVESAFGQKPGDQQRAA